MKRFVRLFAVVIAALLSVTLMQGAPARAAGSQVEITSGNWNSVKAGSSNKAVLVMVGTSWCGACKQLWPELQRANSQAGGKWTLAHLDAEEQPSVMNFFGRVGGYPTVFALANGQMYGSGDLGGGRWSSLINGAMGQVKGGSPAQPKPTTAPTTKPTAKPTTAPTTRPTSTPTVAPTQQPTTAPTTAPTSSPMPGDGKLPELPEGAVQITDAAQFETAVMEESKKRVVIVDFSKDMCEPCVALAPILDAQYKADGGKWQYTRIDGTQVKDIWAKFNNPWFPTLIAIKDGKEMGRYSGFTADRKADFQTWLKKAIAGEDPGSDPLVMNIDNAAAWNQVKEISKRHPVVVRLNFDALLKNSNAKQGEVAAKMASGDGGKWTLANVSVSSSMYNQVVSELGWNNVMGIPAAHVIYYQGMARTEENLQVLHQFGPDEAALREWVNKMLSHHYKPADQLPKQQSFFDWFLGKKNR